MRCVFRAQLPWLLSLSFILAVATTGFAGHPATTAAATGTEGELWDNGSKKFHQITERNVPGVDPAVADFPAIYGPLRPFDTEFLFHYEAIVLLLMPPQ